MTQAPRVDIVTPAYNAAATIRETIESVRNQTFTTWNLWVIDDGSSDETAEVVREYLTDSRIRLLRQSNRGAAHARNLGVARITGEYVAFLDSDDYWHPEFLEQTVATLEAQSDAGLVWTEMQIIGASGGTYRGDRAPISGTASQTLAPIYSGVTFLPSCCLMRSRFFHDGLRWKQECSPMEDMPIFFPIAYQSSVAHIDRELSYYRVHEGSSTTARGAIGRNYPSMVYTFETLYREYGSFIPRSQYRERMWWIYHCAADSLTCAGTPRWGLFLRALRFRPLADPTWRVLAAAAKNLFRPRLPARSAPH